MAMKFWERITGGGNGHTKQKEEVFTASLGSDNANRNNNSTSQVSDGLMRIGVRPIPDFATRYEYYNTVGKVQNAVESVIKGLNKRDFYFANVDEENTDKRGIKLMELWEEKLNASGLIEYIARDWLTTGNNLLGISDWQPMQITTVDRMIRDNFGNPQIIIQLINGTPKEKNPADFIHSKYIDVNREAWGRPLYHSLTTTFADIEGNESLPLLVIYRQMEQDISKIHHKYASPRVIYAFDGTIGDNQFNKLVLTLKNMLPGDRKAITRIPTLITETVDPKARFTESIEQINGEVEAGLQSSASRLITRPSAMADAREAGKKDDDTLLDIMEKMRRLFDYEIIPRVLKDSGIDPLSVEFRWGTSDSFEIEYPAGLKDAVEQGVVTRDEARKILSKSGWKLEGEDNTIAENKVKTESVSIADYNQTLNI